MATLQATRKQKSFTATEWQEILQHLADQITGWAREAGWTTGMTEAQVLEGYPYPPTLEIEARRAASSWNCPLRPLWNQAGRHAPSSLRGPPCIESG